MKWRIDVGLIAGASVLFTVPLAAAPTKPQPVAATKAPAIVSLKLLPGSLTFSDRRDVRRVLVQGVTKSGDLVDLTDSARLQPVGGLVRAEPNSYLSPIKTGSGTVQVTAAGKTTQLPVFVKSVAAPPVSFLRDVEPILRKAGCNQGTCHGAAKGKNGFMLSLRGYDPEFDYHALVDEVAGRRVNSADPDQSLMLLKPVQQVPHQGGFVFAKNSRYYGLIRQWISEGAKSDIEGSRVARLEVLPKNPTMPLPGLKQNLVVVAYYPDGTSRDVTRDAVFTSSVPEVAEITDKGTVSSIRRGESAVQVAYEGQYFTNEFTILGDRAGWKWTAQPQQNYIDKLVDQKLQRVKAVPAPLCTDADFLRRTYLDLTGLLPSSSAARAFLEDPKPSAVKRAALIERLLQSPEFDDQWTYRFADLLQVNSKFLGPKGVQAFRGWIHDSIALNKPYDQMVRELLTTSGSSYENPAANYQRIIRESSTATENVTQLFLGVRFSCNKCHDHPFERWTQAQYYQLGAYFAQVGFKQGAAGEEEVFDRRDGEVMHPKSGTAVVPTFPVSFGATAAAPTRREALADWLTSPQNPFFAKSMANRIWSYLLGRGIIDPVDDIRNSNPPSNAALLDALTADFVKSDFNLRHLIRTIVSSRVYQSSITTNRWNEDDKINFSHQAARRLSAEQLLDAISVATGSQQKYPGSPLGTHAQQLPDTRVAAAEGFLDLFGRPARESPCECVRTSEVSLSQALNLMNGATISNAIIDPNGRLSKLAASTPDDTKLVEEIYLATLSRFPSKGESETSTKHLKTAKDRMEGAQDLMWALLNSPAFLFNR